MNLTKVVGACSLGAVATFHPVLAFVVLGAIATAAFVFTLLLKWFARQPHPVRKDVIALIQAMRARH
jgi:hypothetical protein